MSGCLAYRMAPHSPAAMGTELAPAARTRSTRIVNSKVSQTRNV